MIWGTCPPPQICIKIARKQALVKKYIKEWRNIKPACGNYKARGSSLFFSLTGGKQLWQLQLPGADSHKQGVHISPLAHISTVASEAKQFVVAHGSKLLMDSACHCKD